MSNTTTKTLTLSLKENNYTLPTIDVVKNIEKNANKILQININGDTMTVDVEVSKPVVKTTTVKKTTKTTAKRNTSSAATTASKTTTKSTRTRTTSKKKS